MARWKWGLLVLMAGLAVCCGGYLLAERLTEGSAGVAGDSGGAVGDIYTTKLAPLEYGRRLYTMLCISCHQPGGTGVAGQYPPLLGSEWVRGPDWRLKRILMNGVTGPIHVAGRSYNNTMPSVGDRWDDDRIAAVLTYVRHEFGAGAGTISAADVARVRDEVGIRGPWTETELIQSNVGSDSAAASSTQPSR